ncbi:MAG: PTS system mannose/fructose/sorbose family transporter subunit IID [Candidatus Asgardarchaeia archaeon]
MASIFQAFLCGLLAYVARWEGVNFQTAFGTNTMLGFLTGLIFGDPTTGLIVGGTMDLVYLGMVEIGGATPPRPQVATIVTTSIVVELGLPPESAVALSFPVAILAAQLINLAFILNTGYMHYIDKLVEKGRFKTAEFIHMVGGLTTEFMSQGLAAFLGVWLGSSAVAAIYNAIPAEFWGSLITAAQLVICVGLAALLRVIWRPKFIAFYLIGFGLAAFLHLSMVAIALFVSAFALYVHATEKVEETPSAPSEEEVPAERRKKMSKGELLNVFIRSCFLQNTFNSERMQASGYWFSIFPVLKKYFSGEELIEQSKAHLEFYNNNPVTSELILGMNIAMIEEGAASPEAQINLKAGLMGPLAGVGDAVWWFTIRVIVIVIGATMALAGNVVAPFFMWACGFILIFGAKYVLLLQGYNSGLALLKTAEATGGIGRYLDLFTIVGAAVVGAVTGTWIGLYTPIAFVQNGAVILRLQDALDYIMPQMLSLIGTVSAVSFLRKGVSLFKLMMLYLIVGIVLGYFGILAAVPF